MKHKLGRATDKPGRKTKDVLTDAQRIALLTFGKYVKLDGLVVETVNHLDRVDEYQFI